MDSINDKNMETEVIEDNQEGDINNDISEVFGVFGEDSEEDMDFFGALEEEDEESFDFDGSFSFGEDQGSFDLDLSDLENLEVSDEELEDIEEDDLFGELLDLTEEIETGDIVPEDLIGMVGLTDEQVDNLIDALNEEILHYNIMQDCINYRTLEIYTAKYESTMETNQKRSDIDEGYTKENLNALIRSRNYANMTIKEDRPLVLSELTRGLHSIQETLSKVLDDEINRIVMSTDQVLSKNMQITNDEDKHSLKETLDKIISAYEPKIKTEVQVQEHDINELKEAQNRIRSKVRYLAPIVKENVEAVYEIISITEVTDEGTTLSESRNFMEIRARRVYEGNVHMPMKEFNEKYKEEINLRVSTEMASLTAFKIARERIQAYYNRLTSDLDVPKKEIIVKPVSYRYKKALVTFTSPETITKFVELVEDQLRALARERKSSDLVIGVTAGSRNYEGRFKRRILEKTPEYPRYTEAEIEDRLNKMIVDDSLNKLIDNTAMGAVGEISVAGMTSRKAYHSFDTPVRSFIKTALTKYEDEFTITTSTREASDNVREVFEKHKQEIVPELLVETFTYLKNLKESIDRNMEEQGTMNINYSIVADIITFGEEEHGFVDKFLRKPVYETYLDEETGKEVKSQTGYEPIPLMEFISDKNNIEKVEFGDLFGRNKEEYRSKNDFNAIKHNGSNKISMKVGKALKNIDIDLGRARERVKAKNKGGVDVESELIQIPPITNGIDEYLNSIADAVIKANEIQDEISDEAVEMIIETYKEIIQPINEGMTREQIFSNPKESNAIPAEDLRREALELRRELTQVNVQVALNGEASERYARFLRSNILTEILGDPKWELAALQDTPFLEDFIKVAPLVGIVSGAEEVIYSTLERINPSNLDLEYEPYLMLKALNLPNPDMEVNTEPTAYQVGLERLDRLTNIPDLINNHPIPVMRDITFMNHMLNSRFLRRIEMAARMGDKTQINSLVRRVMSVPREEPMSAQVGDTEFNTDVMMEYVNSVLETISYTNIDLNLIKKSISNKRFSNSRVRAQNAVEESLEDFYYSIDEIEELIVLKDLMYWIESTTLLPVSLNMMLLQEYNEKEEELKRILQRKAVIEGSAREIKESRRKMNALYKAYLTSGKTKYLETVDRDYVDFKLLTQVPIPGKPGGEYSIENLVSKYYTDEDIDTSSMEADRYLEVLLTIEQNHPNIKDELPLSIIDHVENNLVTQINNKKIVELLKKDTSFNLSYKTL